jgi:hypothetical protein
MRSSAIYVRGGRVVDARDWRKCAPLVFVGRRTHSFGGNTHRAPLLALKRLFWGILNLIQAFFASIFQVRLCPQCRAAPKH